jgi:superfamily II DNA or RNA helicase
MRIPVFIHDRIYIPRAPVFDELLESIRVKFNYANPKYSQLKAIGRWTGGVERRLNIWDHVSHPDFGDCLSVPRGGLSKVRKAFEQEGYTPHLIDRRVTHEPITDLFNDVTLRPDQERLAAAMMQVQNCLIRSPTGSGKCLSPNTPILKYNGDVVPASHIKRGDYLIGPDSRPREVLSTTIGHGPMYKITPTKGEPWYCNHPHILTLINTSTGDILDIPLYKYLKKSKWFKHTHKLFMTGVDFQIMDPLPIDPYFIGVWLGDGRKDLSFIEVCNPDPEIKTAMEHVAKQWSIILQTYDHPERCVAHRLTTPYYNYLLDQMRYVIGTQIRIPKLYLKQYSRKNRLELLAGLIDTDGYQAGGYYEITQRRIPLSDDIEFLARSLGFRTTRREKIVNGVAYQRINILGDISEIPVRIPRKQALPRKLNKDAKRVGFKVEYVGCQDFVGWTLDGDGRFLLGDFTVTHNTETALKAAEYMLKDAGPVLVIVWETELMDQWVERICQRFGLREKDVGMIGGRKKKRIKPLTVGMQQSLRNKIRIYAPQFGGVICDEVQRFAATTYEHVIDLMPAKYRIGISADETRRDKQEFRIYDMFGEVAEEIERAALIKQGKLHDVIIRCIPTDFDYILEVDDEELTWAELEAENKDTNDLLDILCDDDERNDLIWHFMSPVLKQKHSTLVITRRVEHAKYWEYRIRSEGYKCGLMIGGRENETVFKTTKRGLLNGNIQVAVGTIQKIGQALDIPPWERGFIISPCAQNKQQFEQILGRLRRTSEGKTEAVCYYIWDKYLYPGVARSLSNRYPSVFIWDDEGFLPVS